MIKRDSRTILAIDASVNGSGVVLVSNNPDYSKDKVRDISGTSFFILSATTTSGVAKNGQTKYQVLQWNGDETVKVDGKSLVASSDRSTFVFEHLILHLLEKYHVTHLVIEGYAMMANGRIFDIAEFTGILKHLIRSHLSNRLSFTEIPPMSMKKYVAQSGTAKKEAILYHIEKKYRIKFDDEDIADAFGLAVMSIELGDSLGEFLIAKKTKKKPSKKETLPKDTKKQSRRNRSDCKPAHKKAS
jgi:Holliday junction resolvasome RuvABC endonuclease subunit